VTRASRAGRLSNIKRTRSVTNPRLPFEDNNMGGVEIVLLISCCGAKQVSREKQRLTGDLQATLARFYPSNRAAEDRYLPLLAAEIAFSVSS